MMRSVRLCTRVTGLLLLFLLLSGSMMLAEIPHSKIDAYLHTMMEQNTENAQIEVYAVLADRLKAADLREQLPAAMKRKARQAEGVRLLKAFSEAHRAEVMAYLQNAERDGMVSNIRVIWAVNTVVFSASNQAILELATGINNVEKIFFNPVHPIEQLLDDNGISKFNEETGASTSPLLAPQPGLTLINAPSVWAEGDSGAGVIVANIDTGTDWDHSDLANNIWNNLGEDLDGDGQTMEWNGSTWVFDPDDINGVDDDSNGLVDDFVGWDYVGNDNDPAPSSSHGTSTAGIVAGDGTAGTETGVAPRAKIMILEPNGEADVWIAQQYAMDKGADIVTSSLSYKWYFSPQPNYPMWREVTDMELALGMVHTNSTSNDGNLLSLAPIPYNISAPGNCPPSWLHPDQTVMGSLSSVIGCGNVHASTDLIVSSSPHGPAAWEDIQATHPSYPFVMPPAYQDYPYETSPGSQGLLKPDVSSPGDGTTSTSSGGGYSSFGGTSGATPHVAGTAALLLGANPDLEPADVSRIIQTTAIEKGAAGKDSRYGAGRIDAYAAYLQAVSEIDAGVTCDLQLQTPGGNGTFNFRMTFTNNSASNEQVDIWGQMTGPNGYDDEVFVKLGKNFLAGGSGTKNLSYTISSSDLGPYTLTINIGTYPSVVDESCSAIYDKSSIAIEGPVTLAEGEAVPETMVLQSNYPNPFNPSTTIRFGLNETSPIEITVYNMLGERVVAILNDELDAGYHTVEWNGRDQAGQKVSSGIYLYQMKAGNFIQTRKMLLTQ